MVLGPVASTAFLPPPWQDRHNTACWTVLLQRRRKEKRKPFTFLELLCAWISAEKMYFTESRVWRRLFFYMLMPWGWSTFLYRKMQILAEILPGAGTGVWPGGSALWGSHCTHHQGVSNEVPSLPHCLPDPCLSVKFGWYHTPGSKITLGRDKQVHMHISTIFIGHCVPASAG